MKFLLLLALVVAANAALAPFHDAGEYGVKGRYIVVLQDGVDIDVSVDRFLARAAQSDLLASIKRKIGLINAFVATFPEEGLDILRALPGVAYVEEDEIIHADAVGSWGLDRIDQRNLPLNDQMSLNGYGSGAHVYVIDSGINPYHNDFSGRASVAADFIGGDGIDCNGHGTHCAGTVASDTYGVARQASVYGLRTLSCAGSGYKSDSIEALNWVASYGQKPGVVSMSLGGSVSSAQNAAVASCRSAGFIVVVSAGNDDGLACNKSPASAPEAITVGATDSSDTRSYFSNYGSCVDIFAPGSSIKSLTYSNNYGTSTKSGTSMSCPHVSGIAAVLAAIEDAKSGSYNAENVYSDLINSATSGVISDAKEGYGTPNLMAYCA